MLVNSSPICEYSRQMALNSRFKTGFYCNFGRPIDSRGQMDARTRPGPKIGVFLIFGGFLLNFCPVFATLWQY